MPAISSFHVGAFRGLRDTELGDLGRVNLLVGGGNCGKTSLLEAMAILGSPQDIRAWSRIARTREARGLMFSDSLSPVDAIRWLFPHRENSSGADEWSDEPGGHNPIEIAADGQLPVHHLRATCDRLEGIAPEARRVPARSSRESEIVDDEGWLVRIDAVSGESGLFGYGSEVVEYPLWRSSGIMVPQSSKNGFRSVFLPPYAHRVQAQNAAQLSRAVAHDQKYAVEDLLRQLDPDLIGLELLSDARGVRPVVAVRHRKSGLSPVSTMGDGFRRALMIALSIRDAREGILLIDEIEAALHVSALDKILPWLIRVCDAFNVQIFATTHSLETIDSITRAAFDLQEEISAYYISPNSDGTPPKRYSSKMLSRLVNERGLDIR